MPVCTILAGPNGSGKSTVYRELDVPGPFINADVLARKLNPLNPEQAAIAAGRLVLAELDRAIRANEDFVYETTLSSHQSIALMQRARHAGYEIGLVFVGLRGVFLNVERVASRVAMGGHDISEQIIRRRYTTSFARLSQAIILADVTTIYDNSELDRPILILQISRGGIEVCKLDGAQAYHRRIADIASQALSVTTIEVLSLASR